MGRTLSVALSVCALALAGCVQGQPPLTPAQKADIGREVLQQVHQDIQVWQTLAIDETMKGMQESPDFALVMADGKSYDFAQFRKLWAEMAANGKGEKLTPQSERVIVLAPDLAIYAYQFTAEFFGKDGSEDRYDLGAGTYLYRKVGSRWLFAYGHESGNPPAHLNAPGAAAPPPPK